MTIASVPNNPIPAALQLTLARAMATVFFYECNNPKLQAAVDAARECLEALIQVNEYDPADTPHPDRMLSLTAAGDVVATDGEYRAVLSASGIEYLLEILGPMKQAMEALLVFDTPDAGLWELKMKALVAMAVLMDEIAEEKVTRQYGGLRLVNASRKYSEWLLSFVRKEKQFHQSELRRMNDEIIRLEANGRIAVGSEATQSGSVSAV